MQLRVPSHDVAGGLHAPTFARDDVIAANSGSSNVFRREISTIAAAPTIPRMYRAVLGPVQTRTR